MAKPRAVWGIDIGQTALKALRCVKGEDGNVIATTYDYIEYPKILSLPDVDAEELVQEALTTFLGRNELEGDFIAMSVSGQAGLSRFFRPPPVDRKTLPDIVKYEVKQQIPFPIDDVVWDWQTLGGTDMDDVVVDAEVGLFAIKRDMVYTALRPFEDANIEVDLVQLSPLSIYNVVCTEVIETLPNPAEIDPENPPESFVVLSMGTDSTDLIMTNGVKLWLRNIPIGGNHFTKQLTRELKMTHANAEHLKRNVRQLAEDEAHARKIFQAMRPLFNDLLTEIQRSLTFFRGIEKNAKIERAVLLGNAAQLPGLRQFLTKQLELDIVKISDFKHLSGSTVVEEKSFKDNVLAFAPCYGLCLQGLEQGEMNTNLLPHEFIRERLIRSKKPWVLAAVAAILAGMTASYWFGNTAWFRVDERFVADGRSWDESMTQVQSKSNQSSNFVSKDNSLTTQLERLNDVALELSETSESRGALAELTSVISQFVPREDRTQLDPIDTPFDERNEIYVDSVEMQHFPDLSQWRGHTAEKFERQFEKLPSLEEIRNQSNQSADGENDSSTEQADQFDLAAPGWVVEMQAHHFHNNAEQRAASQHQLEFVRQTLLKNMLKGTVRLPGKQNPDGTYAQEEFRLSDVGVFYPTVIKETMAKETEIPNPYAGKLRKVMRPKDEVDGEPVTGTPSNGASDSGQEPGQQPGQDPTADGQPDMVEVTITEPESFKVRRYDFTLQFAWIPQSRRARLENKRLRLEMEAQEAEKAAQQAGSDAGGQPPSAERPSNPPPSNQQPAENPAEEAGDAATPDDPERGNNVEPENPENPENQGEPPADAAADDGQADGQAAGGEPDASDGQNAASDEGQPDDDSDENAGGESG